MLPLRRGGGGSGRSSIRTAATQQRAEGLHRDVIIEHPQGAADPGQATLWPDGEHAVTGWVSPIRYARRLFRGGITNNWYHDSIFGIRSWRRKRLAGRGGPTPPQRQGSALRQRRPAARPMPVDDGGSVTAAVQVGNGE